MNAFKKFTCSECGGTVDMSRGTGRTRNYSRGYDVPIPDDFLIPTCNRCGDIYVLPEIEGELNAILEKRFLRMQAAHYRELVDVLMKRHGVKQLDIVRACAVTPAYLSHVLNGKRVASTTLTRLLEAFVACEAEFNRHLRGDSWASRKVGLYAVQMPQMQELAQRAVWNSDNQPSKFTHWLPSDPRTSVQSCSLEQVA